MVPSAFLCSFFTLLLLLHLLPPSTAFDIAAQFDSAVIACKDSDFDSDPAFEEVGGNLRQLYPPRRDPPFVDAQLTFRPYLHPNTIVDDYHFFLQICRSTCVDVSSSSSSSSFTSSSKRCFDLPCNTISKGFPSCEQNCWFGGDEDNDNGDGGDGVNTASSRSLTLKDNLHFSLIERLIQIRIRLKKISEFVDENDDWIGFRMGMRRNDDDDVDGVIDDDDSMHDDDADLYVKFSEIIAIDAQNLRRCGKLLHYFDIT